MRAHKKQLIEWILLVVFWLSVIPGWSQEKTPFAEENTYITVSGVVKDKQNRKTLEYVNVSVPGRSVGTVTNADGEFSLKIEDAEMVFALEISHIGYHNNRVRLDKEHLSDLKIYLTPHANMLNEIVVYAHNPRLIVEEAIRKIPVNYSNKNNIIQYRIFRYQPCLTRFKKEIEIFKSVPCTSPDTAGISVLLKCQNNTRHWIIRKNQCIDYCRC